MKIEEIRDLCTGCGACVCECPQKCISMEMDAEGFYMPKINMAQCIHCGKCEKSCHIITPNEMKTSQYSYYGYSLNSKIRECSTSGGVFSALAQSILELGGNVYGAAFDFNDLLLKHQSTDCVDLSALQKSKYIESFMGDTITKIKQDLKNNRKVLFCGTPCQAAGVRHVLGGNDNLIICDFICHGVPSAGIFRDYVRGKLHRNERLIALDFRPKDSGWSAKNIKLVLSTTTTTTITPHFLDVFYRGFITENAFLRRSCYECRYRQNHHSDITIADFWGYKNLDPKLNDEKGLSLIITNTTAGKKMIEGLTDFNLNVMDNRYSDYVYAPRDYSKFWEMRKKFYSIYKRGELKQAALKTYMPDYYTQWIKFYLKKLLGK